ncbi:MAG: haloacid dehalogenase-like hydrolase [Clostridiales bacterium]|nr:haloacid dehalogenase-like hydrolase [Clostridiales bacterium]
MQIKTLAIYDFDGTMLSGDSIVRYIAYAMKQGFESPWSVFRHAMNAACALTGLKSINQGKSSALKFLRNMDPAIQEEFNRSFCREILTPRLYPKAIKSMKRHHRDGCHILLVSASPDIYLKHMKEFLPIDEVLASPTDEQGIVSSSTRGAKKVRRVEDWAKEQTFQVDWHASWAFGNSIHDLPVMRLCGRPICINPTRHMRKEAVGLPIEYWKAQDSSDM